MLISFHIIRNHAVNNLNRGEDGEPKTTVFGGTIRKRISSQCMKKKWRDAVNEAFNDKSLKRIKTKAIGLKVYEELIERGYDISVAFECGLEMKAFLKNGSVPTRVKKTDGYDRKELLSQNIKTYSEEEVEYYIKYVCDYLKSDAGKSSVDDYISSTKSEAHSIIDFSDAVTEWKPPIDACLMGRMNPDKRLDNMPSAMFVSHAISTHGTEMDLDFYSAQDDLSEIIGTSSSMYLDNNVFDTACVYQHAALDTKILEANLKGRENSDEVIREVVRTIVPIIAMGVPEGKQTTMADRPTPSAVLIEVFGTPHAFTYANAFLEPFECGAGEIVRESERRLTKQCEKDHKMFGDYLDVKRRLWMSADGVEFPEAENVETLKELTEKVVESL